MRGAGPLKTGYDQQARRAARKAAAATRTGRRAVYDLVLAGGTLIDGTLGPRRQADLALEAGRVAAIGQIPPTAGRQTLDVAGLVVAPGFIDVHNHSDGWLLRQEAFAPKLSQGFTTEVLMSDGIAYAPLTRRTAADWFVYLRALDGLSLADYRGWQTIAELAVRLDRRTAQNVAFQVPYGNVRVMACGWGRGPADDTQINLMRREVRLGMEAGATGVSTGLDYVAQCFAARDEIVRVCQPLARYGGIYVTHVRYKLGVVDGVKEAVRIGREAGVAIHLSHLKGLDAAQAEALLDYLDREAVREVDLTFDVYPYLAGSTLLSALLPYEVWEEGPLAALARLADPAVRRRLDALLADYALPLSQVVLAWMPGGEASRLVGKTLAEWIDQHGGTPGEAMADLLIDQQMAVLAVMHAGDDRLVEPFLSHPRCMIASDGIFAPGGGRIHPRLYGTAPRVLGPLVRQRRLFTLEQAVHKLSGLPAERFGLRGRGRIEVGAVADLAIFDPETINDLATYERPHMLSAGMRHVLVGGVEVWREGEVVRPPGDELPGRALRFGG